jgi:predicted nucleic acid-binding protein
VIGLTALLDANVLFSAPIRDIMLELAVANVFHAKWTADIHEEWITALLRTGRGRNRTALERTRTLMDTATLDCLVTGYEALIPALSLPDPDDRHVLAAAIVGRCDVIVTMNLIDFPSEALAPFGVYAQHPDSFLTTHFERAPELFCDAVRRVRDRLKAPPYGVEEYLAILRDQGLVDTTERLAEVSGII